MAGVTQQPVTINFGQGVNLKEDPWQIAMGQWLALENSVFTTQNRLTKRNGYGLLATIPGASTVTTYLGNLMSLGNSLDIYSEDTKQVIDTGTIQPMGLSVLPMVRSATSQTTVDAVIAPNGLSLETWLDSNGNSYYQINDSETGGTIVPSVSLTTATDVSATMPRVAILGNYFIITYLSTVSSNASLRYIAIPFGNPTVPIAPVTLSTAITSITAAYDILSVNVNTGVLYLAWEDSGAIKITQISNTLVHGSVITLASAGADLISLAWDSVLSQLWVSFYKLSTTSIKTAAYSNTLSVLLAITAVSTVTLNNGLTSTANNGVVSIFYEVNNFYSYDSSLRTDYLSFNTCTIGGVAGTSAVILRSVGLASKAVLVNDQNYMLVCYSSAYQPSYFLISSSGNIIGKVAYSNGGGYIINQILPQINVSIVNGQTIFQIGYLFKDFLASIVNPVGPAGSNVGTNKTMGASAPPIYTNNGINIATWTFGAPVASAETGSILHMGMGYPVMFDGVKPVEHQFHVWPDALEVTTANSAGGLSAQQYYYQGIYNWTDGQGNPQYSAPSVPITVTVAPGGGLTFTSSFLAGATSLTVSSATGLFVGQILTDSTTPATITVGTYITSIVGSVITISQPTTADSASSGTGPDTLSTVDQGTNTVYFPTLRLTDKTVNKVRLNLYRWSTANQNFYEVTSVSSPTLNNPAVDYITITDTKNDTSIVGNSLIYTTGGTVEDIAAPSFSVCSMFDDRLWILDAEDGTFWYSKQVLPGTGVEFSDLFTYYVAPTQGAQGSTGLPTASCPMDTNFIIFKKDAIYYITGTGPDNTGSGSTYSSPIYISSTVGCANPNSIVQTDEGIMFQSDKGIWLLSRGLQPSYIGSLVERLVIGNIVNSANVIPGTTQVRFIMNTGITLMYDYFYRQWGWFTNTPGVSATLYQGLHTYLDQYDRIVQETPGAYLDIATPINMSALSGWIQLQGLSGYQRLLELQLLGSYISPHTLIVEFGYDYGPLSEQAEIQPINFTGAYGSDALFGQTSPYGGPGSLEQWRVFNAQQQCQSFQISIQEVYDPSMGVMAGAGLTLSAFTAIVGVTRGYRPVKAATTVGTG